MNEDFIRKEMLLSAIKVQSLEKKLSIAKTGLKVIISDGSDTLGVAQKTLDEIEKTDLPHKKE